MSFDFASQQDGELFMSLKSLVNRNNGFFKSLKQAQFLFKQYKANNLYTPDQAMRHYGVALEDGQILVTATAHTRWADYGTRSVVPVMFAFVVDRMGVAAHHKIKGNGNLREGWAPDPSKSQLLWTRDASVVAPFSYPTEAEIAAARASEPVSQHVGTVGEKISRQMVIKRMSATVSMYGESMRYVFNDDAGNVFIYFGTSKILSNAKEGDNLSLSFKVKAHNVYNGVNQTQIAFR